MTKKRISDIPKEDRPREKLEQKGPQALSDLELMAILLGSGVKGHDVMTVADRILKALEASKGVATVAELKQIEGVGLGSHPDCSGIRICTASDPS